MKNHSYIEAVNVIEIGSLHLTKSENENCRQKQETRRVFVKNNEKKTKLLVDTHHAGIQEVKLPVCFLCFGLK